MQTDAEGLLTEVFRIPIIPVKVDDISPSENDKAKLLVSAVLESEQNEVDGKALTEAGLFTNDGTMYNHVMFSPINKTKGFKLSLVWEIIF